MDTKEFIFNLNRVDRGSEMQLLAGLNITIIAQTYRD